jgi:hypothetical protein
LPTASRLDVVRSNAWSPEDLAQEVDGLIAALEGAEIAALKSAKAMEGLTHRLLWWTVGMRPSASAASGLRSLRLEVHVTPREAECLGHPQPRERAPRGNRPERVRDRSKQAAHLLGGEIRGFALPLHARPVMPVQVKHRVAAHHTHSHAVLQQGRR